MADATFITATMVDEHLLSLTTARLPAATQPSRMARACRRVVTLIKGYHYEVPTEADAPGEWKGLAVEWLAAQLYGQFSEYFRAKIETIDEVETRIVRAARVEPVDNKTHVRSTGKACNEWDYEDAEDCGTC